MTTEIKVPALPESVADATVAKWYKQVGDSVSRDENLVDLETDKVMLEVPAAVDGVIESITKAEGTIVKSDEVLCMIKEGAVAAPQADKSEQPAPEDQEEATAAATTPQVTAVAETKASPAAEISAASAAVASAAALSPAVRRLVAEHGLDASTLKGTGKDGRVLKEDVVKVVQAQQSAGKSQASSGDAVTPAMGAREEKRVPMSRLRARVAERLMQAKHSTAMLTTFNEIDMQPVMDLRAKYKDQFMKMHDTKLGFMSFFIKAVLEALKRYPTINASIDGQEIVYHNYFDIGVAVSSPRGLVVPVIRNVDQLSMADIEKSIVEFAQKSQNNQLTIEEMTGGTFTITNGGVFGSMLSTPILNPPQCGILGMHNIVKRAVVVDDEIVIRPIMYVALSYDHQLVDGRESVGFLVTIKELLEDPARILLAL